MARELTIHFVRNYTVEPLGLALQEAAAPRFAFRLDYGAYDNMGAELASLLATEKLPDIVFLSLDLEYFAGGIYSPKWNYSDVLEQLQTLLAAVEQISQRTFVLLSNFVPPFRTSLPLAPDHPVLGRDIAPFRLNELLREFVALRSNRCGLLDFERVAARLGEAATLDRRFGLMMKAPFKAPFVEAAARQCLRFLQCRFLPPKKVLVLDCDNTIWGGVIGELGHEKIQLDPYEYPGVAYHRFQAEVLSIVEKGFLVCLCSKNDEAVVWEAFEKHPHFLLKREHIAGHRVNWSDKATNLQELARELNLGLDSMVFVDDNPAECELIRSVLPEVAIIQVPSKIYEYPGILNASGYFDRLSVSQEDKDRAHYYRADKDRGELQRRHVDATAFLRELRMKAIIRPVRGSDLGRVSQLCQRTNQFNVTTRRYTESELAGFLDSSEVKMFLLQAEDRFGSLGQSGLIIYRKSGELVEVDTFLMSCRIIGRQLDRALFAESLRQVRQEWSFDEVRARFLPTAKNSVVAGLWREYGFRSVSNGNGEEYACSLNELTVPAPDVIELAHEND